MCAEPGVKISKLQPESLRLHLPVPVLVEAVQVRPPVLTGAAVAGYAIKYPQFQHL